MSTKNKTSHKNNMNGKKKATYLAYVVAVIGNMAAVPQIVLAWKGPAPGLSVTTWMLFVFVSLSWLWYALVHSLKPLIFAQIIGLSVNLLVVAGWMFHNLNS